MIPRQAYVLRGKLLPLMFTCFFLTASVFAQQSLNLSGRIIDAENQSPLMYAQIALSNSTLGTVSNEDGQFFLGIPEDHLMDTVVFTYLGYETVRKAVSDLASKNGAIKMRSKEISLKEVEVLALTPEEVLRRAFMAIPANYGEDSLLLTGFYRSQKFAGKKLAEFTEAVIEDLKTGYFPQNTMKEFENSASRSNKTRLIKGRVISDTNLVNSMGDVGKNAGCLGCIFMEDMAEFSYRTILDEEIFRAYSFKMEESVNPEGGRIYHIWFDRLHKGKDGHKGELFIDGSSFAIMKIIRRISYMAYGNFEKGKYKKTYSINNIPGWIADLTFFDETITYSKRDKGWYLSTIRNEQWVTFNLPSTDQKIRMGYKNDLVVTDVSRDPEQIRNFHGDKKAGIHERWDQLVGQADEGFWANYNYLPIEEQLKKEVLEIKAGK